MERKLHSNLFGNSHIFFENMMTTKQACFTGTAWLSNSSLQQPLLRNFFYGAVPFDAGACFHLMKYQRWEHCTIAPSRRNILQEINCCGQRSKDIPSALLGIVYIEGLTTRAMPLRYSSRPFSYPRDFYRWFRLFCAKLRSVCLLYLWSGKVIQSLEFFLGESVENINKCWRFPYFSFKHIGHFSVGPW